MDDFGVNQALVEELFLRYCDSPGAVPEDWQRYFDRLPPEQHPELTSPGGLRAPVGAEATPDNGGAARSTPAGAMPAAAALPPTAETVPFIDRRDSSRLGAEARGTGIKAATVQLQGRVSALVNAFRVRGHLYASLDPLNRSPQEPEELLLERYGLGGVDPDTVFSAGDMAGPASLTLGEIVERLKTTYCRTIGVEFTFIEELEPRLWLQQQMESTQNRLELSEEDQIRILTKLTDAKSFEQFLQTSYVGAKRFSLEGGESFIPMMDLIIERAADLGVKEIVIAMAHRGRLNVLANIMDKKLQDVFAGFEDKDPEAFIGRGDVKYHMGYSTDRVTRAGNQVHLSLAFNPSHLEFACPVVEGRVRAKQDARGDTERRQVLPLLVHGDAAMAGQGVVTETLNLSELRGYRTGGTIHVVINNQIGFTTNPEDSRSTRYCTDVTRMLRCPVFHVNGEDPEAVAQAVNLATEFRQKFQRDVVIDLYCYRKYGHNESDEPRFTQPDMYRIIDDKRSIREIYVEHLQGLGKITEARAREIVDERRVRLEAALNETRNGYLQEESAMKGLWSKFAGGPDDAVPEVPTSLPEGELLALLEKAHRIPEGFEAHPTVARIFKRRIDGAKADKPVDWGTAELLAYATLLASGANVRLSGQDSPRGTFSHRHATITSATGERHVPLMHLADDQGRFEAWDSPLSEAGVLGFDFGYSLDSPKALVVWEAQFGDFANGAQVIIDQFITSCEDKWHRLTGLVMLLPHGFEGQGPEHSSARLERFLTQCAEDNIQVCNLTTPAQIFHCLRRQVLRPWRKPLVVMSPKSLLRHPGARSNLAELSEGSFERLIGDNHVPPGEARRVVLCSGKIYYDLFAAREMFGKHDVAIVRLEQLYPLQPEDLMGALAPHGEAELVWVQEEPWNMGGWYYIRARLPDMLYGRAIRCIARPESASPATGSKASHELEQKQLLQEALQ